MLTVVNPSVVHVAVPDNEVCSRVPYMNPVGVLSTYVPVLYDVWIILGPAAPNDAIRGCKASVANDIDRVM